MAEEQKGEQSGISTQMVEWIGQNGWWMGIISCFFVLRFIVRDRKLVCVRIEYSMVVGAKMDEKDEGKDIAKQLVDCIRQNRPVIDRGHYNDWSFIVRHARLVQIRRQTIEKLLAVELEVEFNARQIGM
jgi:hypothetical protein